MPALPPAHALAARDSAAHKGFVGGMAVIGACLALVVVGSVIFFFSKRARTRAGSVFAAPRPVRAGERPLDLPTLARTDDVEAAKSAADRHMIMGMR